MMSNNTFNNSNPLAKADELHKFESSFFPAGGAPQLANIPQAPPAPTNLNNVKSKPMNLKTRNWGPKLENGYGGLNRSLYDRPNSWDSRPIMDERAHLNNNNVTSFPSSSTSTSRSLSSNVPPALAVNKKYFKDRHNNLIHGKRLRLHNWGHPTAEGWSGMNRDLYNHGMKLERDVFLNDLRFKYGPRPNFQQQERAITTDVTNIVETVPIYTTAAATTTTAFVETGPAKVLATTVPVPMLNPPINDGRRYAKLYKKNTNALGTDKGVSKLVKRRGTRRDHLVQPNVPAALTTLPLVAAPSTGALTVIQPATLVAETRSVLPVATTGILPVAGTSTLAPPAGLTRADRKREKRVIKDQQRFAKKEQRAARKANKNGGVLPAPIISAPVLTAPPMSAMVPMQTATYLPPLQPTTTTLVGAPALPIAQPATFVGETRSVLTQEATLLAPVTTTGLTPIGGVSARPLDHAHVLAGQLGNAPVKRPRRARKAKKGTEQPLYSNIISTTPAPLTATTIGSTAATTTNYTTSSIVEGTTVIQPATLVGETRNIVVDPLVQQQGMIKQEYNMAPAISPLATGNPIM